MGNKIQLENKLWEIYNDRNFKGIAMFSYEDWKELMKEVMEASYNIGKEKSK